MVANLVDEDGRPQTIKAGKGHNEAPVATNVKIELSVADGQIEKISEFLSKLNNVVKVRVLPYHNYAGSKYSALGMENSLPQILPTEEEIKNAEKMLVLY